MMSESMFQQLEICQGQRDAALARERVLREELAAVKKNGQFWYKSSGQAIDAMTLVANQRDALQLRLNVADQRIDDLTSLAEASYKEGWEMGWLERHHDAGNENRVSPWSPPKHVAHREWMGSEARAAAMASATKCTAPSNEINDLTDGPLTDEGTMPAAHPEAEHETVWCDCGDGHAANSYGAGFMDANKGVCENCDAAKPQCEPSHGVPGTSGVRLNMLANQGE